MSPQTPRHRGLRRPFFRRPSPSATSASVGAVAVAVVSMAIGLALAPTAAASPAFTSAPVAGVPPVAFAPPVAAHDPGMAAATARPAPAVSLTAPTPPPTVPVMIVLDASGSMNESDAPGPRIDAAKSAVKELVATLPADSQVGLLAYGTGTGSSDSEKDAGCRDVTTLAPVAPLDAAALDAAAGGVTAAGYTPIGAALRAAADGLPNEGPRSIVLVSDGEDTCAPPTPCDIARELEQQGIDLTVHTVGFKVDGAARDQLTCIAQATGGPYSDATDAAQLTQTLQTKVD